MTNFRRRFGAAALTVGLFVATGLFDPAWAQNNINDLLTDQTEAIDAGTGETTEGMPWDDEPAASNTGQAASAPASGDTATMLQQAARQFETATALVIEMRYYEPNDIWYPSPVGTAWAFQSNLLGTNAHVAEPVIEALGQGRQVYVVPNKSRGQSFRVSNAVKHPRYGEQAPNVQGKKPVGIPYDVGVLQIEGAMENTVRIATVEQLQRLDSGAPIAYVGFPMENLQGDNVNLNNPIAIMQTGNIAAVSDYYLEDTGFENNKLLRHNLPSAGGASGSAIFLPSGEVVAVHNAGNYFFDVARDVEGNVIFDNQGWPVLKPRIGNSALINYAQRIDILYDLIK